MKRECNQKEEKKTYTSPKILQVAVISRAQLMDSSYHNTLGLRDSDIDDSFV